MKALSLHQPWASLIAEGVKTIETRSWRVPVPMIGQRFAIHAARTDRACWNWYRHLAVVHPLAAEAGAVLRSRARPGYEMKNGYRAAPKVVGIPFGAVVATGRLADCVPIADPTVGVAVARRAYIADCSHDGDLPHQQGGLWLFGQSINRGEPTRIEDQRPYGDFQPGRWAWLLADVEKLDVPVPWKGRQGWFEVDL